MSMIEKVARALCAGDPDDTLQVGPNVGRPRWTQHTPQARAAIEAMREPTEGMEVAGSNAMNFEPFEPDSLQAARAGWKAMIQAALEGEG